MFRVLILSKYQMRTEALTEVWSPGYNLPKLERLFDVFWENFSELNEEEYTSF
jgi:hypothetical protein